MPTRAPTPWLAAALALGLGIAAIALGGEEAPQPVDTSALPAIGEAWLKVNPYRGNPKAIEIGASGYNQNCARCHGLEVISGGIAPDLRYLDKGEAGDEWFINRFQHGSARNGKVYMPAFGPILGQKTAWAIRSFLDTVHTEAP